MMNTSAVSSCVVTSTTTGVNYTPTYYYTQPVQYVYGTSIATGTISTESLKPMSKLYKVYVVDSEGDFLDEQTVVAKTEEDAKFKAGIYNLLQHMDLSLDDVTIILQNLGTVKIKD